MNYSVSTFFKIKYLLAIGLIFFCSCNDHVHLGEKEIVEKPEEINSKAEEIIQGTLKDILQNNLDSRDTFKIKNATILQVLYEKNSFQPLWSASGSFAKWTDSLLYLIDSCRQYGLFPQDYFKNKIQELHKDLTDTARENKLDASKWAYSDLLLTSSFVQLVKDIKKGRLLPDSLLAKDTTLTPDFFQARFRQFKQVGISEFTTGLEPQNLGYKNLKFALQHFLQKADFKNYTRITGKDSLLLQKLLYKRVAEEDSQDVALQIKPDSITFSEAIKKYQKEKGLKADGKISTALITKLNDTDKEKFIRIAITMDRYKILQPLPHQYIWVNIPSFYLQLVDNDSVILTSKIVVGKPATKTPLITSAITDMITYPKWHIPESIIKKDILPGLKKDPGYTLRKGYTLLDKDGNEVDPFTVTWSAFKENIPYTVVQGSGDENALGVLKFNFPNKYAVYLHDTNQRYLFSRSNRALSHGCVRVQAWKPLAHYLLRNDSAYTPTATPVTELTAWLANKEKHYIPIHRQMPLFIRYFTCEGKDGRVVFYDDIYGEDKRIREKIFADK